MSGTRQYYETSVTGNIFYTELKIQGKHDMYIDCLDTFSTIPDSSSIVLHYACRALLQKERGVGDGSLPIGTMKEHAGKFAWMVDDMVKQAIFDGYLTEEGLITAKSNEVLEAVRFCYNDIPDVMRTALLRFFTGAYPAFKLFTKEIKTSKGESAKTGIKLAFSEVRRLFTNDLYNEDIEREFTISFLSKALHDMVGNHEIVVDDEHITITPIGMEIVSCLSQVQGETVQ